MIRMIKMWNLLWSCNNRR